MSKLIKVERIDGVALVTVNRPKQLNALNAQLARDIIAEMAALDQDPDVGCFVIGGNDKAFAAGADISEMSCMTYAEISRADYFSESEAFAAFRTPKIAAVDGYALGGGCGQR